MAKMDVKTDIQGPDEIKINLVREDYLETSNTYRIFFEICLALFGTILGCIISSINDSESVSVMNWLFLVVLFSGCVAFFIMTRQNYKKAKCQSTEK